MPLLKQPRSVSAPVGQVSVGVTVEITCTANGDLVTANSGSSSLWDKIGPGYIPAVWVYTGTSGPVAPPCP